MLKITFPDEDVQALLQGRLHHPQVAVRYKMEVLFLRSQGLPSAQIAAWCDVSPSTVRRYLHTYQSGGLAALEDDSRYRPESALQAHREVLKKAFREQPPATVAQAAARIHELTGLQRKPTQVRSFLHQLGLAPRQVGSLPAKADPAQQDSFRREQLEPRLREAQAQQRLVYFMDAAHFVYSAYLGWLWSFTRLWIPAPAGRARLNVLAALHATSHHLVTVSNLGYINAATVCQLLTRVAEAAARQGLPVTVVLDNARYQRCAAVQAHAAALGIELLFLPPYSPNLNLIERFWRLVKKECLYARSYRDFADFKQAILTFIEQAPDQRQQQLQSLLTLRFQTLPKASFVTA